MKTLHLSVAQHDGYDDLAGLYRQLVGPTFAQQNAELYIDVISWDELWRFVHSRVMAQTGIDVSEVGSTWLGSLADTDALTPLPRQYLLEMGGHELFTDAAWNSIELISGNRVLFLPFTLDVRLIYYWRDALAAAGIDEKTAFSSAAATHDTLAKLTRAGEPSWGVPTCYGINTLYHISSWIWGGGKDYLSDDGTRTAFCEPEVLNAIMAFYRLSEFMSRPYENHADVRRAFLDRQICVTMSGPWFWNEIYQNHLRDMDSSRIGVALPPGPPFLGGSMLVLWRHADGTLTETALSLLQLLVSKKIQRKLTEVRGLLPVHRGLLGGAPYSTDTNFRTMVHALSAGRYLPTTPIWAHLESSLVRAFGLIWSSLKTNGFKLDRTLLERHLEPLAKRFDRMLEIF